MGVIDSVVMPNPNRKGGDNWYLEPHMYYTEEDARYSQEQYALKELALQQLKKIYEDIVNAKYSVCTYLIYIDHAIESISYSLEKYKEAKSKIEVIVDKRRETQTTKLNENIKRAENVIKALKNIAEKLEEIEQKLSSKHQQVIEKNDYVDGLYW